MVYDGIGYDDYYDEHSSYNHHEDIFYDELEDQPQTLRDTWTLCMQPTIVQITFYVVTFVIWNVIFRLTTQFLPMKQSIKHFISLICGGAILFSTMDYAAFYVIGLSATTYILLFGIQKSVNQKYGYIIASCLIGYLVVGELIQSNIEQWHKLRGPQMILVMKGISMGFDIDVKRIVFLPNFFECFGYLLCPSNCSLGPWVSYNEYIDIFKKKQKKTNFHWIYWISFNSLISIICVLCSNCLIAYFIGEYTSKWLMAYRDAMSYRFSHYFVIFLSHSLMLIGGFQEENNRIFGYTITKPWLIEMPRSLVNVVIVWNISMHRWLKTYVFRTFRIYGAFKAILLTYIISTLLHGLNFPIAGVLLTLGIATYVEFKLRKLFATIFNACVLASPCNSHCGHRYKSQNFIVFLSNFIFGAIAMLHLTYLGVMFDAFTHSDHGFSYLDALEKWSKLHYLGHWLIFSFYILYFFIEN